MNRSVSYPWEHIACRHKLAIWCSWRPACEESPVFWKFLHWDSSSPLYTSVLFQPQLETFSFIGTSVDCVKYMPNVTSDKPGPFCFAPPASLKTLWPVPYYHHRCIGIVAPGGLGPSYLKQVCWTWDTNILKLYCRLSGCLQFIVKLGKSETVRKLQNPR